MGTRSIVSTNEPQISPDDEPVPEKVVFASMVGVWLCYFLLITLRGAIVGLATLAGFLTTLLVKVL